MSVRTVDTSKPGRSGVQNHHECIGDYASVNNCRSALLGVAEEMRVQVSAHASASAK